MMQYQAPSSPAGRHGRFGATGLRDRRAALLLCSAMAVLSGFASVPAHAQILSSGPYFADTLYAQDYNVNTVVRPEHAAGKRAPTPTATFVFNFIGNFPVAAREAFTKAGEIWATYLQADTINVDASWDSLGASTLGTAGPRLVSFSGAPFPDTWYASALAESMAGENFTGSRADIVATFNSQFPDWYFGTEGNPPPNKYDLVTVVLHELGHGLGFVGSFDITDDDPENGQQDCPNTEVAGMGCWGIPTNNTPTQILPMVFDRFTEDQNNKALLNTNVYPNPSTALAD
ncbi:MAG TPA: hypothetical protein VFG50_10130, partial [Rhodothermales bacterium]|nr:hypothetical protein [Rhodothermales bacterium]